MKLTCLNKNLFPSDFGTWMGKDLISLTFTECHSYKAYSWLSWCTFSVKCVNSGLFLGNFKQISVPIMDCHDFVLPINPQKCCWRLDFRPVKAPQK